MMNIDENVGLLTAGQLYLIAFIIFVVCWIIFYKLKENWLKGLFGILARIYIFLGTVFLVFSFSAILLNNYYGVIMDHPQWFDQYVRRTLRIFLSWFEEKKILDIYTIGFLMISTFKYGLDKLKDIPKNRLLKVFCGIAGSSSIIYLLLIPTDIILNTTDFSATANFNTNDLRIITYIGAALTVAISYIQWFMIDKGLEMSENINQTSKRSDDAANNIESATEQSATRDDNIKPIDDNNEDTIKIN